MGVALQLVAVDDFPPEAEDDSADVTLGAATFVDVLANDRVAHLQPALQAVLVRPAAFGEAEVVQGGPGALPRLRYTAGPAFVLEDSVVYQVSAGWTLPIDNQYICETRL
jgi:hypothetical protein